MNNNTYIRKNLRTILSEHLIGQFRLPSELVIIDKGATTVWGAKARVHHFVANIEVWVPNLLFDADNPSTDPNDLSTIRGFWEPKKVIITLDDKQEVKGVILTESRA